MKIKFTGLLIVFFACFVQLTFAQEIEVTGIVLDENDMPLPGATVIIQGTTTRTSTDFDGMYDLSVKEGDILEFSYVGYDTQTISVTDNKTINVTMQPDAASLTDLVVTVTCCCFRRKKNYNYGVTQLRFNTNGFLERVD